MSKQFAAELVSVDARRIPAGKRLRSGNRLAQGYRPTLHDGRAGRRAWPSGSQWQNSRSHRWKTSRTRRKPYAPFTTSTLQQEANRKLGFTARRTMQVAQSLYENGHITYMRTDSTNLAAWPSRPPANWSLAVRRGVSARPAAALRTKVKNTQEAHEAIRPAGHPFDFPEQLRGVLNADEFKLYDLIWKRTIASQMADARGRRITITVEGEGAVFQTGGKTIDFPGYLRAYVEGSDDPEADLAENERCSPVTVGERSLAASWSPRATPRSRPPVQRSLADPGVEELGIGRPSTYASIIDTILAREYVFKKGGALVPTWVALPWPSCSKPLAQPGRLPVHGPDGRRSRRDQPGRGGPRRLSARSTSATARSG